MSAIPSIRLPYPQWHLLQTHLDGITPHYAKQVENIHVTESSHYMAIHIRTGRMQMRVGNQFKWVEARAGEWIFQQPGKYSMKADKESSWITMGFSIKQTGVAKLLTPPKSLCWKTGPLPALENRLARIYEAFQRGRAIEGHETMVYKATEMGSYLHYNSLFYEWMAIWLREMRQQGIHWQQIREKDEKIIRVVDYMQSLPWHQNVSIPHLAAKVGISSSHLFRLFQSEYGMAPGAYRQHMKLKQAIQELQTTQDEICTLASRFGCTPSWFSAWIKQETGKTPRQIRLNRSSS